MPAGGGAYFDDDATVVNCVFANNRVGGNGGGAYFSIFSLGDINSTVTNSTFYNNSGNQGGGIYANYGVTSRSNTTNFNLRNSILINNMANFGADELYIGTQSATQTANIDNNLIQGGNNEPRVLVVTDGGVSISNIVDASDAAVVFASTDAAENDYLRLTTGSPAINAGNNSYIPAGTTTDVAGNARIQDGTVDLGAYEGAAVPQTITFTSPTTGTVGTPITLVATATSTGEVTYAITEVQDAGGNVVTGGDADDVATLSGSTLTLVAVGTVTVTASQAGGDINGTIYATATETQVITITVEAVLGIEEDTDDFVLYPNPTSGKLHFSERVGQFRLYSVEGRLLETQKNVRSADLTALPSGLYFVEVVRDGRSVRYRIMRE